LDAAIPLYMRAVAVDKAALGPEHPLTIAALGNLAMALADQGRRADAIRIFEEVLPSAERRLGHDHPRVQDLRERLAQISAQK
jgi:tetratricopeptide (TPR) repeat protein